MRWPPAGQEEELRDSVLVVAGEYLNQMTDGTYPAPRVCYTRRYATFRRMSCAQRIEREVESLDLSK